jgi:hypothetical protein
MSQFEEGADKLFNLIRIKGGDYLGDIAISLVEEVKPPESISQLLIVEGIHILQVAIKSKEELLKVPKSVIKQIGR